MADELTDYQIRQNLPDETKDIFSKYMESFYFLQPRKRRQASQIALLNNLQRGDENISSTLILTLFNRAMSNLYDDKMQIKFVPGELMEQKTVDELNVLAQNDYREMDKPKLDYDWCWDTLFFGRGYIETLRFDPARKILQPHVINPLVFGYDPFFSDVQEWRYYWKWITKSSAEIKALIDAGVITGINSPSDIPSGIDPYLWNYKIIRERAKYVTPQSADTYQGDVHQILEFFGYDASGDKCVYWLDRNFSKILYHSKLNLGDGDNIIGPGGQVIKTKSKWPLVIKEAFREPHASVVFSVADLLEDKHRARSVLLNLAYIAAKDKANPIYQYNPNKVVDVSQLFSRQIAQHIPVESVTDAIAPLNKDSAMDPSLQAFMQMLNNEAADPIGTGIQSDAQSKGNTKQSATSAAITQQMNDMAQSLQSKVMQFGEAEFWGHWYQRYKNNAKEGDEKLATIVGVKGLTFQKINLHETFKSKFPPGVLVFSAKEAEYKRLVQRRDLMEMYPALQTSLTPDGLHNFNKHVFFPLFLNDPQVIDVIMPDSSDEIRAKEENDMLGDNKMPQVAPTDNHEQHIAIHYMAGNSWAKWIHIQWHEEALSQQKQQQMQMQQQQLQSGADNAASGGSPEKPPGAQPGQLGMGQGGGAMQQMSSPQVGQAKKNPQQAAASYRQETLQNIGQQNNQMN